MAPDPLPLTKRQQAFLDILVRYRMRYGCSPTMRELGDEAGIPSTGNISHYLVELEKRGYIRRGARVSRGIELLAPALPGGWPFLESPT